MKSANMIVEFLVKGAIGSVSLTLFAYGIVMEFHPATAIPQGVLLQALAGVLVLPTLYYASIVFHHASCPVWIRLFHRRWLDTFILHPKYRYFIQIAEVAFTAAGGCDLEFQGIKKRRKFIMDWRRYEIFQYGSEQLRAEYLKQFHIYRILFGPFCPLAIGILGILWNAILATIYRTPGWDLVVFSLLLGIVLLTCYGGRFRAFRI